MANIPKIAKLANFWARARAEHADDAENRLADALRQLSGDLVVITRA